MSLRLCERGQKRALVPLEQESQEVVRWELKGTSQPLEEEVLSLAELPLQFHQVNPQRP